MSTSSVEATVKIQPETTPIHLMQLATAFWAFKALATANRRPSVFLLITSDHHHDYTFRIFKVSNRPGYDQAS